MQEGGCVKDTRAEEQPGTVPVEARRPGDIQRRWGWVERSVWTERMLTTLDEGVKGGRWYSLMDKVSDERNLWSAFLQVEENAGAAGVDHQSVEMFAHRLEGELHALAQELKTGTYQPKPVRRAWIPKAGSKELRPLGIPAVRDRVAQTALRSVLEPIFEKDFAEHSYGFRPGRGCKDALRRAHALLQRRHAFVVDADLKGYFDTIPHEPLLARVAEKVADNKVLELVASYLKAEVLDGTSGWTPEQGSPQGAVISPLLSNIYLDPLDHLMAAEGFEMVRYADDFVVMCRSAQEAESALERIRSWVESAGLQLHPDKTKIVDMTAEGSAFEFLGYRFEKGRKWPRRKSEAKLKDTIREKTKRTNGTSLERVIASLNQTLRGWFEYFKHCHKATFPSLDRFVRQRLRSLLRKREGKRGPAKGQDHHRWPNALFAKHGLLSLTAAHAAACQSLAG